ncbi:MAG TPA: YbhN family protein [Acidimicrobiales bacterium]|nr:YbhN family protein [Acidimicrobiales bacterium]
MSQGRARSARLLAAWRIGRYLVGLGLAALALWALNGQKGELVGASSALGRLHVGWLLLAIGLEVASFTSFGLLQRRLLAAGGVGIGLGYATALSLAAGAIANSVPGGPAVASIYAFRRYRRRGADDVLAGWTLLATLVCAALALALMAVLGVLLAEREGASYNLIGVVVGVLAFSVVADAVVWQRAWLARLAVGLLQVSRRLTGRPKRRGVDIVDEVLARLNAVRLGWRDLVATIGYALGNWLFDCGALVASFLAVGAGVPWRGLLLAYGAGQLAANLPITPGGLGLVEGSLTIALVALGGSEPSTVAAVVCYRIVSFWGYLPVGWLTWLGLALVQRRQDDRAQRALVAERPPPAVGGESAARRIAGGVAAPAAPSTPVRGGRIAP